MSVLVYADGRLAADSFANDGTLAYPVTKLWKDMDVLWGVFGPLQGVAHLCAWAQSSTEQGEYSNYPLNVDIGGAQLVRVAKNKGLIRFNGSAKPILHGNNKVAFGEGEAVAYGALYMGATAEQAVQAAIHHNIHCNGEVVSIGFDE